MTYKPRRVVAVPMVECRETRCATCPFQPNSAEAFSGIHSKLDEMQDELGATFVYKDAADLATFVLAIVPHFVCHYPLMESLKDDSYMAASVDAGHKIGCRGSHDLLSGALDQEPFVIEARRRLKVATDAPGSEEGLKIRRDLVSMIMRKLADVAVISNQNGQMPEVDGIVSALIRIVQRKPLTAFTIDDLPGEERKALELLLSRHGTNVGCGYTTEELHEMMMRPLQPNARAVCERPSEFLRMPDLMDCEAQHAAHPGTFELPPADVRYGLGCGWLVKLVFEPGERMWVRVTSASEATWAGGISYVGVLDNEPLIVKDWKRGDRVVFEPKHIAAVEPPPEGYRGPKAAL